MEALAVTLVVLACWSILAVVAGMLLGPFLRATRQAEDGLAAWAVADTLDRQLPNEDVRGAALSLGGDLDSILAFAREKLPALQS